MPRSNDKPKTIYAIQCTKNNKAYIGCCVDAETRVRQHFRELAGNQKTMRISKGKRSNTPWQEDYNKHGLDSFKVFIIRRNVPALEAEKTELSYILKYRSNESKYGYNIKPSSRLFPEMIEGEPESVFDQKQRKAKRAG